MQRAADLIEQKSEVGLYLVASPPLGSSYANSLSLLARFLGHAQAAARRFAENNAWLADLDKEFQNLKEAGKLSTSSARCAHLAFRPCLRVDSAAPLSSI